MKPINIVISGFSPYEDLDINPSLEVPDALARRVQIQEFALPDDVAFKITSVVLPISFANAWPALLDTIERVQPDIVIATGVKHAARGVQLERCATNIMDAPKPDVDNRSPRRTTIVSNGPAAYWTRLPLRMILNDFAHASIPATLSSDAGTYVCNSLFYQLLHWTSSQKNKRILAGFVSFPPIVTEHDTHHGLSLRQQIEAGKHIVNKTVHYYLHPSSVDILLG